MNVLEALIGSVPLPRKLERVSGVKSMKGIAVAAPGVVLHG